MYCISIYIIQAYKINWLSTSVTTGESCYRRYRIRNKGYLCKFGREISPCTELRERMKRNQNTLGTDFSSLLRQDNQYLK